MRMRYGTRFGLHNAEAETRASWQLVGKIKRGGVGLGLELFWPSSTPMHAAGYMHIVPMLAEFPGYAELGTTRRQVYV